MIVDPALVLIYVLKVDISDGLYRFALRPADAQNLGLVFPLDVQGEYIVAILLTLPMVWKKSFPILCTNTEAVMELENTALRCNKTSQTTQSGQHCGSGSHSHLATTPDSSGQSEPGPVP